MDYFYLLEVFASEAFNSNAMARHSRTAQYLSALGTLSQALARRQQALAEIESYRDFIDRAMDEEMLGYFEIQRKQSMRDHELAELELRGIDLWINALSGAIVGKDQLIQALNKLADDVAGAAFSQAFQSDEELDLLVAGLGAVHQPQSGSDRNSSKENG